MKVGLIAAVALVVIFLVIVILNDVTETFDFLKEALEDFADWLRERRTRRRSR